MYTSGRSDYGVDPNTVDVRPGLENPRLDRFESSISRQYAYFIQNALNLRMILDCFRKFRKQKDWATNPELLGTSELLTGWLQNLPSDLQINYPADGSPPTILSHFVANMHIHYHLGIISLHRAPLLVSNSFVAGSWKTHMAYCYSSAKCLCRLQEALVGRYGLAGLSVMQRGYNFAIYATLLCTMLHLVRKKKKKKKHLFSPLGSSANYSNSYRSQ